MRGRIDQVLVQRGLFSSRAKAQEAINAGLVIVDGEVIEKPGALVALTAAISAQSPHPWVSRGGVKLAHGLQVFQVDPAGRVCLDVGASTGGFTQVLRAQGAAHVFTVDVGRDQLDPQVRADPGVTSYEGLDARALTRAQVPEGVSLIVADVSFIGLAKALPAALGLVAQACDLVALVKPQFESGPERRGSTGVPQDDAARAIAAQAASGLEGVERFTVRGLIESPIRGGAGALEFLLHARREG